MTFLITQSTFLSTHIIQESVFRTTSPWPMLSVIFHLYSGMFFDELPGKYKNINLWSLDQSRKYFSLVDAADLAFPHWTLTLEALFFAQPEFLSNSHIFTLNTTEWAFFWKVKLLKRRPSDAQLYESSCWPWACCYCAPSLARPWSADRGRSSPWRWYNW